MCSLMMPRVAQRHRGGAPLREDGCAHAIFDREEEDDDSQHIVGEAADEVYAYRRRLCFWLSPPPLVGNLDIHVRRMAAGVSFCQEWSSGRIVIM
jgi:hypothetical protein